MTRPDQSINLDCRVNFSDEGVGGIEANRPRQKPK